MSNLEDDLIKMVDGAQANQKLFHDMVHGDDKTTVQTDNGSVPSVAKTIANIETKITTQISDTATAVTAAQTAQGKAEKARDESEAAKADVKRIVGGSVTTEMIEDDAVTTGQIADGSITTAKLASDPVGLALVFGG